jgi:hypothetical protein
MVPISHTAGDPTDRVMGVARDERRRFVGVLLSVAGAAVAAAVSADAAEADSEGTR